MSKKVVVIGGGAGGAGAAAKVRRLDEHAEIKLFERSGYVSYSNCGLPYHFSRLVETFDGLILNTPEALKGDYNIDCVVRHEVIGVNTDKKFVTVKNCIDGKTFEESYDTLFIAAGAAAIKPNIPGINRDMTFVVKTPDDVADIEKFCSENEVNSVAVIGGGYIGAETAEQFKERGIKHVSIVDAADHLLPSSLDADFAAFTHRSMREHGVELYLGQSVEKFENNGKTIITSKGHKISADMVIMSIGVKPELPMYKAGGLEIGTTGGIIVDRQQRTNIKDVYAIGDLAETFDLEGNRVRIALATPASRQATVAANTAYGVKDEYKGSQGTATLSTFGTTVASIGKTEKQLISEGVKYKKTLNARPSRVGILKGGPGLVFLKTLYKEDGTILGAQAAGPAGAEKRISYIALAMYGKIKLWDLAEFQVAYSPTVDTSFDATNMNARVARLEAAGTIIPAFAEESEKLRSEGWQFIDVRAQHEWDDGHLPFAKLMEWHHLRETLKTLDKNGKYVLNCKTGARSYNAGNVLKAHGFKNVKNLAGGFLFWDLYNKHHK